ILDDQRLAVIALLHTAEAHQYIVCHHTTPLFLSQADDSRVGRRERVKKSGGMTGCYQARGESSVGIVLQIPSDCIGYRRCPMGNPWVGWTPLFMSSNAGVPLSQRWMKRASSTLRRPYSRRVAGAPDQTKRCSIA